MTTFFCIGCGQSPCTKKCEELCSHGIAKRDFCDQCFIAEENEVFKLQKALRAGGVLLDAETLEATKQLLKKK